MNGHFAGVGDAPTKEQYEHGIQVIDEEKEFKYVFNGTNHSYAHTDDLPVPISTHIFNLPKWHNLASIITLSRFLARSRQASRLYSIISSGPLSV
jgi:hypothetical protein